MEKITYSFNEDSELFTVYRDGKVLVEFNSEGYKQERDRGIITKIYNAGQVCGIRSFVSMMIGALDTGFTNKNNPTLAQIHQTARNYCFDTFGESLPSIIDEWGEDTAKDCGLGSNHKQRKEI